MSRVYWQYCEKCDRPANHTEEAGCLNCNAKYYAGIGSRETPPEIISLMESIGETLASKGWVLRSGGASGADSAFERGCDRAKGQKEIYLPKKGFNGSNSDLHLDNPVFDSVLEEAYSLAKKVHPAWSRLGLFARRLHVRNCFQALGSDLKTPSQMIICWTKKEWKPGVHVGGTGQALRIAHSLGIKVYNLVSAHDREQLNTYLEGVQKWL